MKRIVSNNQQSKGTAFRYGWRVLPLIFAAFLLLFSSCEKDEEAVKYTVNVTVQYPSGYSESNLSDIEVKATNTQTGTTTSAKTDAKGVATFSLVSGVYSFNAVFETEEFAFNGLVENTTIAEDKAVTLSLHATSLSGGLVFKEIYYSGTLTEGGKSYFSDQFIEIYNNSDEVIYLDNIGFGALDPLAAGKTPSEWIGEDGKLPDPMPLGNYSFYFKGSGQDHPLQPRTSIVIAQDGIDHKTDPAGNPNSPVNLGNADWELYVGKINGGKDADAAGVPNLEVLYTSSTSANDALYSVFGSAMVLFKFPENIDPAAYAADAAHLSTKPGSSYKTEYLLIPKEYIIEAVECIHHEPDRHNKRLFTELDAGFTFISTGSYSGKSVRRKAKQIIDGKVIYKDTNNSTEDFLKDQTPTPGVHPTTVDQ
ncbi:MAG TPA: hypothetical protein DDZ96_12290 [Porphyromonadaceae bacterium]|jgi:hypothetical protein|uniref:DUF4876 domain-containing protein n=1 Tax=Limibacterium fermenti TaxID=3229863 RepID=UPI000E8445BD|nr:hypothetical protein [Porphyromonadaceae bacterium]HBK31727.1 hypothetical protein [Porphyromonadaceae bacterium]HBL34576.1 hypothetical protein [Porphyromonadaceae bacterium]HBX20680.1 hypothetical protein [Porphyromonadaceae bacterium]HBX45828.1 hypothetical protein [Porphyromonadaceae bacterium]